MANRPDMNPAVLQAMQSGQWAQAETLLRTHLSRHQDPEAQRLLGVVLLRQGNHESALSAVEQALTWRPDWSAAETNRGSILRSMGRVEEAISSFRRAADLDPDLAAPLFNLGKLLKADAQLTAAREPLRDAVRRDPRHVSAWVVLGEVEKALGDIEAGGAAFRHALQLRPTTGAAWWGLANLKTWKFATEDLAQLDRLWTRQDIARGERELIGFARAHAVAQLGTDEQSWDALVAANAFKRSGVLWNSSEHSARIDRLIDAYKNPLEAGSRTKGSECIFIVGLPRSGSTLVEQVLAAHSRVSGASELPDLPAVITAASRARGQPDDSWLAHAPTHEIEALGEAYLKRTERWRTRRPIVVDKLPSNFLHVGAIRRMLPGARIIDCRRDARDNALSCLYQHFAHGHDWSYELGDVGAYLLDYHRLMAHWNSVLLGSLVEIDYGTLVTRPEASIRALLEALDLDFEDACLHPELVRREVRTASAAQVVQAIDSRGVGRWERFPKAFPGWTAKGP